MSREKHDPLCRSRITGAFYPSTDDPETATCWVCDLIMRVRFESLSLAAREIEEYAVARIEHLTHPHDPGFDIAAALRVAAKRVRRLAYA